MMSSEDNVFEQGIIDAFNARNDNLARSLQVIAGTASSLVQGQYFFGKSKEVISEELKNFLFSDDIQKQPHGINGRSMIGGYDANFTPDKVFPFIKENLPNAKIVPTGPERILFRYKLSTKSFFSGTQIYEIGLMVMYIPNNEFLSNLNTYISMSFIDKA